MRILLAAVLATSHAEWDKEKKCWHGPTSRYNETISVTKSGKTCQKWIKDTPHAPKHRPKEVVENKEDHNYCRNPDLDLAGPWCYTTDPDTRWEYCDITACGDDKSFIIWTNFDAEHQSSHLVQVHANPEVVRDQTDQSGSFNVHAITMTNTNESLTEYWALAADYKHKQIYWTDYRAEHIGRFHWDKNTTDNNLYKGMAHGIENLAVDWLTGNLYWTDSDYKWIMVANMDFTYYTQVYKATDDPDGPPYGLAIHSTKKYLFWSTYKIMGATIKRADLTANDNNATNHKTIVKFPVVHDVTGLTVDYTDNRIYWTDFLGSAAVVSSSDFEGNHIINHFHRTGSVFWGVACYDHYLYVSDIYPKFMQDGKKYMLWVVTKLYIDPSFDLSNTTEQYVPTDQLDHPANEQKSFRYSITGRPRGVSVYSQYAAPEDPETVPNPCQKDSQSRYGGCAHICVPKAPSGAQRGVNRVCKCGIGYSLEKAQRTGCYANIQKPPYLVFADVDHGLIFQMSLKDENLDEKALKKKKYNVIPSKEANSIHALCIDPLNLKIYYADKEHKKILAQTIHKDGNPGKGNDEEVIYTDIIAQSCVVDTEGNNIFFVEGETRNIQVISSNQEAKEGHNLFTLTIFDSEKSTETDSITPNIQNIAIDTRRKRLYWTDPTLTENKGKISSSNYDGSDYKVLINELNWPQGIKIYNFNDEGSDVLFFTEALSGIIYEIKLSALDTIGETPWKPQDSSGVKKLTNVGVQLYNITMANPRLKQFHMDIALHGDYLYFTDLKNNAIERFNRAVVKKSEDPSKDLKIETYGPAEFYSLIYMYAVSDDQFEKKDYAKTDCSACFKAQKLCLIKQDSNKISKATCSCSDGQENDPNGKCVPVKDTHEYQINNCPQDTQQSSSSCERTVKYQPFGSEAPKISKNFQSLSLEDFTAKRTFLNIKAGGTPKMIPESDSFIQLPSGTNVIRYEFTDKEYNEKVTCQWTVQAIVHQCRALNMSDLVMMTGAKLILSTEHPCNCDDTVACDTKEPLQPLGTLMNVQCEDNTKLIQPMIEKTPIQEKYNMNFFSQTINIDASKDGDNVAVTGEDVENSLIGFPAKTLQYKCEPTSNEFVITAFKQIETKEGKKITFNCVDAPNQPIVPAANPTSRSETNAPSEAQTNEPNSADGSSEKTQSKGKGGIAAVVIIVILLVVVVAAVMYKKMKTDYDGGFSFRGIFSRAPDPTAEMEVPKTSTPYSAM